MIRVPTIPSEIIVHLGEPDESAKNISIPFDEYIKNVASGEIYPNWPIDAIKANVLAQISFALNRVYNEWYPSKGYDFDILNGLDEEDYIRQGERPSRRKSVYLTETGIDYAKELLEKYGISDWE